MIVLKTWEDREFFRSRFLKKRPTPEVQLNLGIVKDLLGVDFKRGCDIRVGTRPQGHGTRRVRPPAMHVIVIICGLHYEALHVAYLWAISEALSDV